MVKDFVDKLMKQYRQDGGKLPQEEIQTHRMAAVTVAWQPHNYRLYCKFVKGSGFLARGQPLNTHSVLGSKSMGVTWINSNSELLVTNVLGCDIRFKKTMVEVVNRSHNKQWRRLSRSSLKLVDEQVDSVMNDLRATSLKALKRVIGLVGGVTDYVVIKERVEHGVKGEAYLDKIPAELIIDDTVFKKVYSDKTEFKSTTGFKHYIKNRSLEDFSPVIAAELRLLRRGIFSSPEVLVKVLECPAQVLSFESEIRGLFSERDKLLFTSLLFEKFGGVKNG